MTSSITYVLLLRIKYVQARKASSRFDLLYRNTSTRII
jgi:hypothetical protein